MNIHSVKRMERDKGTVFMRYVDQVDKSETLENTVIGDNDRLEGEEGPPPLGELLPLLFVSKNNGIERIGGEEGDISLSAFSIEDLPVDRLLRGGVKYNKDEIVAVSNLMTETAILQRNYGDIETRLTSLDDHKKGQIFSKFEAFPWLMRRDGTMRKDKYQEHVPISIEEKLAVLGRDFAQKQNEKDGLQGIAEVLATSELLNPHRYHTGEARTHYERPKFAKTNYGSVVDTVDNPYQIPIGVNADYICKLQSALELMRDKTKNSKGSKNLLLSNLQQFDQFFMSQITNLRAENQRIKQENMSIEPRNEDLLHYLKRQSRVITRAEEERTSIQKQVLKLRSRPLVRPPPDSFSRLDEERSKLKELNRVDASYREMVKEKKEINAELHRTIERLEVGLKKNNKRLVKIANQFDERPTIQECLSSSRSEKKIFNPKLQEPNELLNRQALSEATLKNVELEALDSQRKFEDLTTKITNTKDRILHSHQQLTGDNYLRGFSSLNPEKSRNQYDHSTVTKSKLKTILEETLYEEAGALLEPSVEKSLKSPPRGKENIPGGQKDHALKDYPVLKSQILNSPGGRKDLELRKEILGESTKCHPNSNQPPPITTAKEARNQQIQKKAAQYANLSKSSTPVAVVKKDSRGKVVGHSEIPASEKTYTERVSLNMSSDKQPSALARNSSLSNFSRSVSPKPAVNAVKTPSAFRR